MGIHKNTRIALVLLVAILGAECAARLWTGLRQPVEQEHPWGHPFPARAASIYEPHPFTGFALEPNFSEHSSQGFRERTEIPREHTGTRIVALGGSNTYGTKVPYEESFPRLLETALLELGEDDVEVINAGVGAYTTANLVGHLALRVLELDPEVCVFELGYADAVARIRYSEFRADYTHDYCSWTREPRPLWRSSVLLDLLASRLGFPDPSDPSIHELAQRPFDPDYVANFAASSIEPFRRNLVSLIGICHAHGVRPVLCTQPVDYDGHPQGKHDNIWREAMREANEATRAVAKEHGVALVDIAALLGGDPALFADQRRMNAEGNRRRASELARFLKQEGYLR